MPIVTIQNGGFAVPLHPVGYELRLGFALNHAASSTSQNLISSLVSVPQYTSSSTRRIAFSSDATIGLSNAM